MSLLRDIQSAAVSSTIPVGELLRQCKILSARLGSRELAEWVEHELNGYPNKDALPEYRILSNLESAGHFVGLGGSGAKNVPIPLSCLPEEWQGWVRTEYLLDGIGAYEQLLRKEGEGTFRVPWPADFLRHYGGEFYQHMNCLQAWKIIPRGGIIRLVDAIRNRVLGFALEIEKANPGAGDAAVNSEPVPAQVVSQVFNTQIYGSVGNVASGSTNVSQAAEINVSQGDSAQLESALRALGIGAEDIASLRTALDEDRAEKSPGMGKRAALWVGGMIGKAATGALKVSVSVASSVLPKLLSQHLGLPLD
jgi:hypothetical protein